MQYCSQKAGSTDAQNSCNTCLANAPKPQTNTLYVSHPPRPPTPHPGSFTHHCRFPNSYAHIISLLLCGMCAWDW